MTSKNACIILISSDHLHGFALAYVEEDMARLLDGEHGR